MSHPNICPICKYHRPLGLSYCPHCRENEIVNKAMNDNDKENKKISKQIKPTNSDLQILVDNIEGKGESKRNQLKKKVNQGSLKSKKSILTNTKPKKNTMKHIKTINKWKLKK